jgi:hypothetical protein
MRRFVLGWKMFGLGRTLGARLVTYADDLVILCRRGKAEAALQSLREIMGNTNGPLVRQRVNQCRQSHDSRFSGHSRKARGFLPGVDIEPRKRGKDA